MTNFNPNIHLAEPVNPPEALAEAVVYALARPMSTRLAWGPLETIVFGLISGGLLPLAILPKRFRDFVRAERHHLSHFTEWLRLRHPGQDTAKLHASVASRLRFRWWLWITSFAVVTLAVVWASMDLAALAKLAPTFPTPFGPVEVGPAVERFTPQLVFDFTARLPAFVKAVPQAMYTATACALLMVAAHACSFYQVIVHAHDVRDLIGSYNAAARAHGLPNVTPPRFEMGLDGYWIAGAIGLVVLGAWWAVPMLLAAAAQARYIRKTGLTVRSALARVVQDDIGAIRPAVAVPMPASLRAQCRRPGCREAVQPGSRFCPHCGMGRESTAAEPDKRAS